MTDATTNVRQKSAATGGKNAMKNVTMGIPRHSMDAVLPASRSSAEMLRLIRMDRTISRDELTWMMISMEALMRLMKHSS